MNTAIITIPLIVLLSSTISAKAADPACLQKPDPGLCLAIFPKWHYDKAESKCKKFIWGGCGGVVPFDTLEECENASCDVDPCTQKHETGLCRARFIRYFFNQKTNTCEEFVWGGCGGSVPFETKKECENARCGPVKPPSKPITLQQRCSLVPNPGPCKKLETKWFWNQDTNTCDTFSYGGCLGTVPFNTQAECESASCRTSKCTLTKSEVLPKLPPGTVTCAAFWTSWFYNRDTAACESFSYSGCSPVGPFTSQKACESARCGPALCAMGKPVVKTPACAPVLKSTWYFDMKKSTCRKVRRKSGCILGRVFDSKVQCRKASCESRRCDVSSTDALHRPLSTPCNQPRRAWVYNRKLSRCSLLTHKVCVDRVPFLSKRSCKKQCVRV